MQVVGEASDGIEAIEMTARLLPDILLMDISMPRMGGNEAARRIALLGLPTRIVILSMHSEEAIVRTALEGGAKGYLVKSFVRTDLAPAIHAAYRGETFLSPSIEDLVVKQFLVRKPAAQDDVAQMLGIRGEVLSPAAACASSLQAIGLGFQLIRAGVLDMAFCGGAEEVNSMVVGSFESIFATAPAARNNNPESASRPFDAQRDGLVCGEGAGVIVLESLDSALARNAVIFGEIAGYNTSASGSHISQSDAGAIRDCINAALHDAGVSPGDIDYVSAHATGTIQGDASESEALRQVFGGSVPVSSLKGGLGHTMGASGAIELAACLMMMRDGVIYPTRNLEQPAEDCQGLNHVRQLTSAKINCFIKNCFAFGGINAVLVCRRFNA